MLIPRLSDVHKDSIRETLGDFVPSFRVIYGLETPDRNRSCEYSRLDPEGPLPIFEAGYQLNSSVSQQIFDASESQLEAILEGLKERIELDPEQPAGMVKMTYRNRTSESGIDFGTQDRIAEQYAATSPCRVSGLSDD